MVAMRRTQEGKASFITPYFLTLAALVIYVLFSLIDANEKILSFPKTIIDAAIIPDIATSDSEIPSIRQWKFELKKTCQEFLGNIPGGNITKLHLDTKAEIEGRALQRMSIPDTLYDLPLHPKEDIYPYCQHVFVDLGTNRGDSVGCAVDASLDVCSPLFLKKDQTIRNAYRLSREFPRLHLDLDDLQIRGSGSQGLSLLRLLQTYFEEPGMESVCVYGVEGNPFFSSKLRQMDHLINQIQPKPIKHLHIHTETIVSGTDGPSLLYLDQYSEKNHFWGSSVLKSMPDIRRTTRQNNGTVVQAQVNGLALSTLLRKTLNVFRQNNSQTWQHGGSLLVKMDVEGAEFEVLKELAATTVMCDYLKMGNNATFVVEFHQQKIKDPEEKRLAMDGLKEAKERLRQCGVKFRQLPNYW